MSSDYNEKVVRALSETHGIHGRDFVESFAKRRNQIIIGGNSIIGGTSGRVLYNNAGKIGETSGLTVSGAEITQITQTTQALNIAGMSLTGSDATGLLSLTQTWNTTGTPTAIKLNVTNTASNAASLLADLQIGGTSQWKVTRAGKVTQLGQLELPLGSASAPSIIGSGGTNTGIFFRDAARISFSTAGTEKVEIQASTVSMVASMILGWSPSTDPATAPDVNLVRDAANVLAQRNGTTAQAFRVYNTFTDASNYERGFIRYVSNILEIGGEAAGTGNGRTTRLMSPAGTPINFMPGAIAGGAWQMSNSGHFLAITDNTYDIGASGATRPRTLYLGTSLNVVAGAVILDTSGITMGDAKDIIFNATTGTKIGTATTQKLSFYGVTPVVQSAGIADADGTLADITTKFNSLLGKLETYGLLAAA